MLIMFINDYYIVVPHHAIIISSNDNEPLQDTKKRPYEFDLWFDEPDGKQYIISTDNYQLTLSRTLQVESTGLFIKAVNNEDREIQVRIKNTDDSCFKIDDTSDWSYGSLNRLAETYGIYFLQWAQCERSGYFDEIKSF